MTPEKFFEQYRKRRFKMGYANNDPRDLARNAGIPCLKIHSHVWGSVQYRHGSDRRLFYPNHWEKFSICYGLACFELDLVDGLLDKTPAWENSMNTSPKSRKETKAELWAMDLLLRCLGKRYDTVRKTGSGVDFFNRCGIPYSVAHDQIRVKHNVLFSEERGGKFFFSDVISEGRSLVKLVES